jgi:hypothetical protein
MQQHTLILKKEQHKEQDVLSMYMPKNAELNAIVKNWAHTIVQQNVCGGYLGIAMLATVVLWPSKGRLG